VAMAEGVLVADGSTTPGCATMHPTAPFAAHRWRSARIPVPGPGSATACPIHGQFLAVRHIGSLDFFTAGGCTVPTMA
jgi:hypothetical protein